MCASVGINVYRENLIARPRLPLLFHVSWVSVLLTVASRTFPPWLLAGVDSDSCVIVQLPPASRGGGAVESLRCQDSPRPHTRGAAEVMYEVLYG